VERDARCVQIIKENLRALGFYDQATVMRAYVRSGLQRLDKGARQFDLIFIGPPYGQNLAHQTLIQLAQLSVLRQDGIIIAQTGRREKLDDRYGDLELLRSRSYGDTTLQFYHKRSG
jgi:16S rRNA (guanine966-N2)-methyltransferase